jgi:glucokinase
MTYQYFAHKYPAEISDEVERKLRCVSILARVSALVLMISMHAMVLAGRRILGRSLLPTPRRRRWLRMLVTSMAQCCVASQCGLCERTMDTFVAAYGGETGNLALKTLPFGGMYIAGGIAPKVRLLLLFPALLVVCRLLARRRC